MTMVRAADSWWARFPDRRAAEDRAFGSHGAKVRVVNEASGLLIYAVDWPVEGEEPIHLRVGFSFLHPFCRADISAPDAKFARHQNPITRGLCLVAQEEGQWVASELVADMIARQLIELQAANNARAAKDWGSAAAIEEQLTDPLSAYFNGLGEMFSAAYLERNAALPAATFGLADAEVSQRGARTEAKEESIEVLVHRFRPMEGLWLPPPFDLPQRMGVWTHLLARWARVPLGDCRTARELLGRADAEVERAGVMTPKLVDGWRAIEEAPSSLTICVADDDADYEGVKRRNGFVCVVTRRTGKKVTHEVVRSFEIGDDMFDRLPIRAALRTKRALLVGCGAIGGFVGMELARAGFGEVITYDHDNLEPGNYIRWPFGRLLWGLPKSFALALMINQHFPWTTAHHRIGKVGAATSDLDTARKAKGQNPFSELIALIDNADVVIDATASGECQQALAYMCREAATPLIIGYGTYGAAGGVVAQFPADAPACFNCALEDWEGSGLPSPAVEEEGKLLPIGCNAETFTGGSYDLQEVSLQIVRSALSLVAPDAFGASDWHVAALSHKVDRKRVLPHWQTGQIQAALPCCKRTEAA
jgi:hypothetical protein